MSRQKLRAHNTKTDHLVANLRGEVGEVITAVVLWRQLGRAQAALQTGDIARGLDNPDYQATSLLVGKLRDELVGRLSELGESKIGRLNFHFAAAKLPELASAAAEYSRLIKAGGLHEKRNADIAHKELPERWEDHRHRWVPDSAILRAAALAVRIMKSIDRRVLGPSSRYLWREMRKRRYKVISPPRASYMLLPFLRLSEQDRLRVVAEEAAEGRQVWTTLETVIDGKPATVPANREWGVVRLGGSVVVLPDYPLGELRSVSSACVPPDAPAGQ